MEPCSPAVFDELRKKPFTPIPSALLKALILELPHWASIAYLYLYERCLAHRGGSTIVLSHKQLAEALGVSLRTASRAFSKLKKEGYIELSSHTQSHILASVIRVACPKELVEKIKQEVKDRKTVLPFKAKNRQEPQMFYQENKMNDILAATGTDGLSAAQTMSSCRSSAEPQPLSNPDVVPLLSLYDCPAALSSKAQIETSFSSGFERSAVVAENEGSVTENGPIESLYQQYHQELANLKEKGLSICRASLNAFTVFTPEQQRSLQSYILKRPTEPSCSAASREPNLAGDAAKNGVHNNNINNLVNLTIDRLSVDNLKPSMNAPVILKETSLLKSKHQVFAIVMAKLKAMAKRGNEIHPRILDQYPSLEALMREVAFHVLYRNDQRTESAEHALQSAAKLIRQGRWSTPKKLLYWQTLKREQLADFHKQQAARCCAPLARTLGASLRIN